MANWTLQHAAEIVNGLAYKIQAYHLLDNFNGLKSDIDDRLSKTTASAQSFVGAVTWAAQQIFTNGLKADSISENTANAGVTVDGVLIKDSMVTVSGTAAANGQIGYASNVLNAYLNGALKTIATTDTISLTPKYKAGKHCEWTSVSSVTLKSGYTILNSTGTTYLTFTADQTISLASVGAANGLDAGPEASNTWYYVYAISNGTDVRGLFSTVNESVTGSITLPSGYTLKAQTPYVWRNDGSSNIIKGMFTGDPQSPDFFYQTPLSVHAGGGTTNGTTNILAAGTAGSMTSISGASFIPPLSRLGYFNALATFANACYGRVRSASGEQEHMVAGPAGTGTDFNLLTTTAQAIEYYRASGSGSLAIDVKGYRVTEIA